MQHQQPPIVDLAPLQDAGPRGLERVASQLVEPCARLGMFHVTGHGIPRGALAEFERATRRLFSLSDEEKATCRRSRDNAWGYYDQELTKNRPDWKEVFDYGRDSSRDADAPAHSDGHNRWPTSAGPEIRQPLLRHHAACDRLARALLRALCVSLGLAPDRLDVYFEHDSSFTRLNRYPRCPEPAAADADFFPEEGRLGVHHHTDAGALTILYQDGVAGLQTWTGQGFVIVEPVDDALTINLGDMLRVWSNDRYRSPIHRVLARSDAERYSAPFFFNPSYDTVCEPILPGDAGAPTPRFRPVSWAHFRDRRSAGDFADYGAEIQIDDYRIGAT